MFGEERKAEILNLLRTQGNVKVSELAKLYNVSEVTIRKDLQELEEEKLAKRVHGGAILAGNTKFEPTFSEKRDKYLDEKMAIARYAASMVEDGDTIALDAGTTTLQIAKNITATNITVVTNCLDIAIELEDRRGMEIVVVGGNFRWETRALVGPISDMVLGNLSVDKAFIGTNGISITNGLTTPNIIEASTKKQLIRCAQQAILVCDSTKFNTVSFAKIADIDELDLIITDYKLDSSVKKAFEDKDVKIILAREVLR